MDLLRLIRFLRAVRLECFRDAIYYVVCYKYKDDIGNRMENLYIILLLVIIGYVALYISGRKYLEGFADRFTKDGSPVTDASQLAQMGSVNPEKVYPMDPTADSDTYDASAVFANQGSKTASKKQLSDAMTRYPLDWSVQGAGSEKFQDGQAQYEKEQESNPSTVMPFEENPTDMLLPDASTLEDEERKILQTYKPKSSKKLLHYSMHDVKHLLDKIYAMCCRWWCDWIDCFNL